MYRFLAAILIFCPVLFAESYHLDNKTWHRALLHNGKVAEIKTKEWTKTDDTIEKVGKGWRLKYGGRDGYAKIELVSRDKSRMVFIKKDELFRITISLDFVTKTFVACYEIGNMKNDNQFTIYTGNFRKH